MKLLFPCVILPFLVYILYHVLWQLWLINLSNLLEPVFKPIVCVIYTKYTIRYVQTTKVTSNKLIYKNMFWCFIKYHRLLYISYWFISPTRVRRVKLSPPHTNLKTITSVLNHFCTTFDDIINMYVELYFRVKGFLSLYVTMIVDHLICMKHILKFMIDRCKGASLHWITYVVIDHVRCFITYSVW